MPTAFAAHEVCLSYGTATALDRTTFTCRGHRIGLLGPNGAGKTSLLSIATGAVTADAGWVQLGGPDSSTRTRQSRRRLQEQLGYLPQDLHIFPGYTCEEFLRYVGWLRRVPTSDLARAVSAALEQTGLESQARAPVRTLSGGMRQRLGVAQTLVNRPAVVVLDEPTVGLDPQQRVIFRRMINDLPRERVVVIATHLVQDVAAICDEVVILRSGVAVFVGTTAELAERGGSDGVSGETLEAGYLDVMGER